MKNKNYIVFLPPQKWEHNTDNEGFDTPSNSAFLRFFKKYQYKILNPYEYMSFVFRSKHPFFLGLDIFRALVVLILHRKAAAVVCVFESSSFFIILLKKLFFFKPPIIIWDVTPDDKWELRKKLQDYCIPRADFIFALSPTHREIISRRWNISGNIINVWHHVDTNFYSPDLQSSIEKNSYVFSIGDDHSRDWGLLIEAINFLQVKAIIKTKYLLDLTSNNILIEQISCRIDYSYLKQLYANSSCVILTLFQTNNLGGISAFLEAASMNKFIIISANEPIRDYFNFFEHVFVIETGNINDLLVAYKKVSDLINKGTICSNRATLVNLFSEEIFSSHFEKCIDKTTNNL